MSHRSNVRGSEGSCKNKYRLQDGNYYCKSPNAAVREAPSAPCYGHWAEPLALALLLGTAFCFGWPRFRCGVDLGDEGNLAYGAVRVLEGQMPSRDFVSIQPPLAYYSVALVFKLFGTSLLSLHGFGFCLFILIPLLVYGLARQFSSPAFALGAAVPAVFFGISFTHFVPYAVWQAMVASLAAAYCCLRTRLRGRAFWPLAAGVLTVAAMLLRQDEGLYLLLATGIYFASVRLVADSAARRQGMVRPMQWWLAGFVPLMLAFGGVYFFRGGLAPLFRQTVVFPLATYTKTSSLPFPRLNGLLAAGSNAYILLYYLVPLVVALVIGAVVLRALRHRFGIAESNLTFLAALTGLFYLQVVTRSDLPHLLVTLPPFFVLASCSLGRLTSALATNIGARRAQRWVRGGAGGLAVGFFGFFLWLSRPLVFQPPLPEALTLRVPRGQVRVPAAENLQNLVETVRQLAPSDRAILCLPYQPMLYFLCQRRNPTRWNFLWPGDQTSDELQALVAQARKDPPAVVVLFEETKLQAYAAIVLDYVHDNYRLVGDAEGLVRIYLPN